MSYIEGGPSQFCEMSAMVTNCVSDPLRWFYAFFVEA